MNLKLLYTIPLILLSYIACGQTGEPQYFFHEYMFDSITISENRIKKITVQNYISKPDQSLIKDCVHCYTFNEHSQLLCSESYNYDFHDSIKPKQQTVDCYEYSNGYQESHKRFRENRDSAEWTENFSYEFNDAGLISKVIVTDITHPYNSNETTKFYDSKNRLIKSVTDYDYVSEYKYDSIDNLYNTPHILYQRSSLLS